MAKKKTKHDHGPDSSSSPAPASAQAGTEASHHASFPIVALGASAGGLAPLRTFFANVAPDSGMAYIVVVHLAPDQRSAMAEILDRVASIPVTEAEDGEELKADHACVAPPGKEITVYHGKIHLLEPAQSAPLRAIDPLFRSLGKDQHSNAAAIVLSGSGTDGSLGVKEVKAQEGLVLVQSRETTEHPDMPRNALLAGVVDMELAPEAMPEVLVQHFAKLREAAELKVEDVGAERERWLQKIFAIIRTQIGHDFAGYKRSTLLRRIHRRMALQQIEDYEDYLRLLRATPVEVQTLFREFLIGVTQFFREPEAFDTLRDNILPGLLDSMHTGETLRAWVPGCSTGEEAYSLAIVIHEALDRLSEKRLNYQIFATDIDGWAIQRARAGVFPKSVASDVSPERIGRFFSEEEEEYRVRSEIRERIVFSVQDILRDPPFSRLDLLCCRNLLIYLERPQQERILRLFHYTMRSGGAMMLGSSESLGAVNNLFETADSRWKIFTRRDVGGALHGTIDFPTGSGADVVQSTEQRDTTGPRRTSLAALTQQALLAHFSPTAVLVDSEGEIIHIQGRTGKYLEAVTGPASYNILDMARRGLRLELSSALREASGAEETIVRRGVTVQTNGEWERIDLSVKPLVEPSELRGRFLVVFQPAAGAEPSIEEPEGEGAAGSDAYGKRIEELERELKDTRESHQATVEKLEATNEELRSANEEMQSSNEELQSTNEELESSKEELQSLNEELSTVNAELQNKLEELAAANDDMRNLLNSTEVASVFIDNELCIRRYADRATEIINLIETDIGRPLSHVSTALQEIDLSAKVQEEIGRASCRERVYCEV